MVKLKVPRQKIIISFGLENRQRTGRLQIWFKEVGFNRMSYFSCMFKRQEGITLKLIAKQGIRKAARKRSPQKKSIVVQNH